MWNENGMLRRMRSLVRAALPERAFLRRDRGDGLFVTNAPAFDPAPRLPPGFHGLRSGGLLRILPDESWLQRLERAHPEPPDELCRSLMRFRGMEIGGGGMELFIHGLKLLDMGNLPPNEIEAYDRALRQRAAVALRGGSGGGLYGAAILNHQIQKKENEI